MKKLMMTLIALFAFVAVAYGEEKAPEAMAPEASAPATETAKPAKKAAKTEEHAH